MDQNGSLFLTLFDFLATAVTHTLRKDSYCYNFNKFERIIYKNVIYTSSITNKQVVWEVNEME